ncbi:class I SAM-dependent methyltransferase [Clostridium aestuarii]|uniref:Class I SAM-dependent methyltransferase n=1 Tax=Clostridium aestuarii TaxID=338193 RepID=A0ABT4D092_9CLOT|nr:class I SAM-dependent methyltransferase [Clostridium aestuarii]MCY6484656.1 class I SAM-dependent methyltransferase [Clostridium aestuarii]
MKKEILINLQNQEFKGNVLDIGLKNYGVVYNIYKYKNKNFDIEYIEGDKRCNIIEQNYYDTCVMFLSFGSISLKIRKIEIIKNIYKYLKDDGILYIWDIDKGYGKIFEGKIKILLPNRKIKEINVKNLNILKNISKKNTIKLLENYFDIINLKCLDDIYYIKAQKKGDT